MKTIGLSANCDKPRAPAVLERIGVKARELGLSLCADEATAAMIPDATVLSVRDMAGHVDALMALGGDGTMLRAVRDLAGQDVPVMGLNLGSLGFMTSIAEEDLDRAMDCLAADEYRISPRTMIRCTVESANGETISYVALNDVVVRDAASSRVITLNMAIDGETVASYVCDGLIVSTPTGSTGHSLAAGGPIIVPGTRAFVISWICPHSLSSRPLVMQHDRRVSFVCAKETEHGLLLSVDGQVGRALTVNDTLHVERCAQDIRFIHLPGYSYFSVLRHKLGWRGSHV